MLGKCQKYMKRQPFYIFPASWYTKWMLFLLPKTLQHLANQKTTVAFKWELIIVNNNSTDGTASLAKQIWKTYNTSVSLRVVNEEQSGLSFARERGMHEAVYDTVVWCDDDNWLCDNYLQTAYTIMDSNSDIGALGGWCEAAFETEKPSWFDTQSKYVAVSKQGKKSGDITNKKGCVYGAGMVLRKSHWLQLKKIGFPKLTLYFDLKNLKI